MPANAAHQLTGEAPQGAGAVMITRGAVVRVLASEKRVHCHASESTVSRRTIDTPRACSVGGQRGVNGLESAIGMAHRLAAVRMSNDLGLRNAIRMIRGLRRRCACGRGIGRGLPLRYAGRKLHEVVLLARTIPLGNPASREMWRGERGALGAR